MSNHDTGNCSKKNFYLNNIAKIEIHKRFENIAKKIVKSSFCKQTILILLQIISQHVPIHFKSRNKIFSTFKK